jgi:hypothetical protein
LCLHWARGFLDSWRPLIGLLRLRRHAGDYAGLCGAGSVRDTGLVLLRLFFLCQLLRLLILLLLSELRVGLLSFQELLVLLALQLLLLGSLGGGWRRSRLG